MYFAVVCFDRPGISMLRTRPPQRICATSSRRRPSYIPAARCEFLRGEVTMTKDDGSAPQAPAFVHCWYMAEGQTEKVSEIYGAVGPMAE